MSRYTIILCLLCLGLSSCVSYKAKFSRKVANKKVAIPDSTYFTLFLIGDAGYAPMGKSTVVLDHLKEELSKANGDKSAIIWLGDNLYPVGLSEVGHEDRAIDEHRLMAQVNTMQNFSGQAYFIPGNHDWYRYQLPGVLRQEAFLEENITKQNNKANDNFFLPDNGCGDPQRIELIDGIDMILMDSQWFLRDDNVKNVASCQCNTREEFLRKLDSELDESKATAQIVALHHPPYTYGHHGGGFRFRDHIFPLNQVKKRAYLPLPVLGTVFNYGRNYASEQDNKNPIYKRLVNNLTTSLDKKGSGLVISGHEHNLQHIQRGKHNYIVSGAGSKNNPVRLGKGSLFSIGEKGYVKLVFISPKSAVAQFIVPSTDLSSDKIIYSTPIIFTE